MMVGCDDRDAPGHHDRVAPETRENGSLLRHQRKIASRPAGSNDLTTTLTAALLPASSNICVKPRRARVRRLGVRGPGALRIMP
jgi:hypothetical protein